VIWGAVNSQYRYLAWYSARNGCAKATCRCAVVVRTDQKRIRKSVSSTEGTSPNHEAAV
jgi:hypothetical protein